MISEQLEQEMTLLGACVLAVQRIEYALYGLAAHASHLPEAHRDRRLRELDPAKFLRGDPSHLKVTLGQLVTVFGDRMLIRNADLDRFVSDRNLLIHGYYRKFHLSNSDVVTVENGIAFLLDFLRRTDYWNDVIVGLVHTLMLRAAQNENRLNEILHTAEQQRKILAWHLHAAAVAAARLSTNVAPRNNETSPS